MCPSDKKRTKRRRKLLRIGATFRKVAFSRDFIRNVTLKAYTMNDYNSCKQDTRKPKRRKRMTKNGKKTFLFDNKREKKALSVTTRQSLSLSLSSTFNIQHHILFIDCM